jgi:hypothetical protein
MTLFTAERLRGRPPAPRGVRRGRVSVGRGGRECGRGRRRRENRGYFGEGPVEEVLLEQADQALVAVSVDVAGEFIRKADLSRNPRRGRVMPRRMVFVAVNGADGRGVSDADEQHAGQRAH